MLLTGMAHNCPAKVGAKRGRGSVWDTGPFERGVVAHCDQLLSVLMVVQFQSTVTHTVVDQVAGHLTCLKMANRVGEGRG